MKAASGSIGCDSAAANVGVDPEGFTGCPTCHLVHETMTNATLAAGATWRCQRCGELWDKRRIAMVVAYNAWESARRPRR